MLLYHQSVVIQFLLFQNLSVGENPVICSKCLIKLETNYNFKKRCIFTEESLLPFVVENVKIDLKEIRSLIIKSEETDNDKHVCRLCLQFIENNMTLCDSEKKQFQNFFPEIVSILFFLLFIFSILYAKSALIFRQYYYCELLNIINRQ